MSIGFFIICEVFWLKMKNSYNPRTVKQYSNLNFSKNTVIKKRLSKYLILLVLLITNVSWWSYIDRPHVVKPGSEKLDCVSYNPYRNEYSLDENKKQVKKETIDADFEIIAQRFNCVRTYTSLYGMDAVPEIAEKH